MFLTPRGFRSRVGDRRNMESSQRMPVEIIDTELPRPAADRHAGKKHHSKKRRADRGRWNPCFCVRNETCFTVTNCSHKENLWQNPARAEETYPGLRTMHPMGLRIHI